jgi:hypothetical protein
MGRVVNVVQAASWTSVPLFAVYLVVPPTTAASGSRARSCGASCWPPRRS